MNQKYIVAIEIGSSKIHGAVAKLGPTGRLNVIATESMRAVNSVRYGRVSNVQEVSANVNTVIRKLENHPAVMPRKIRSMYISLGGRTFSTVDCSASLDYGKEVEINADTIKRLKEEARFGLNTTKSILDLVPRKAFVDNKEVANIIGEVGKRVRMEFTALLCAQDNRNNLERIKLDSPNISSVAYILRQPAIADMVLDDTERQLGVVLVDYGAETITISIHKDNALQFAITLPMGSRNITRDLKNGLSLTEDKAEQVKIDMGNAVSDRHGAPLTTEQAEVNQYVQARSGEIIANIIHQIESAGFKSADLPAGIVIVGGGSQLRGFAQSLNTLSKMKVRQGTVDPRIELSSGLDHKRDVDIVAILAAISRDADDCLETVEMPEQPADEFEATATDAAETETPKYRNWDEDESDVLDDDPDDDEGRKQHSEGFLARIRRKNRERAEQRRRELLEASRREAEEEERQRQIERDVRSAGARTGVDTDEPDEGYDEDPYYQEEERPSLKDRLLGFFTSGAEADLDDRN